MLIYAVIKNDVAMVSGPHGHGSEASVTAHHQTKTCRATFLKQVPQH